MLMVGMGWGWGGDGLGGGSWEWTVVWAGVWFGWGFGDFVEFAQMIVSIKKRHQGFRDIWRWLLLSSALVLLTGWSCLANTDANKAWRISPLEKQFTYTSSTAAKGGIWKAI